MEMGVRHLAFSQPLALYLTSSFLENRAKGWQSQATDYTTGTYNMIWLFQPWVAYFWTFYNETK